MVIEAELALRKENLAYVADLRAKQPADNELRFGPFFVVIEAGELADLEENPERYGQAISDALFQENGLVWALGQVYGIAKGQPADLRLRLTIDRSAPELDGLRWELLRIPGTTDCLSTTDDIFFSRYAALRRDPPAARPLANLRALLAVSSPSDLGRKYNLPALDGAFGRPFAEGHGLPLDVTPAAGERCTLDLLASGAAGYDVLIVAAHGQKTAKGSSLLLEDSGGRARVVPVERLAARLQGLRTPPRLLVLLSGHSVGAVPALMAAAGIPAVVALHGALEPETGRQFLAALLEALRSDGVIDRALGEARRVVGEPCDEFAPALFMSLNSAALWKEPPSAAAATPVKKPGGRKPKAAQSAPTEVPLAPTEVPLAANQPDRAALYDALTGPGFTLDDLEELCFFLRVEWDALRGQTRPTKARALVRFMESRGRLDDLLAEMRRLRPGLMF